MLDLNVLHREFAKRGSIPLATLNIGLSAVACCVMICGGGVEATLSIVGVLALLNGGTSIMDKKVKSEMLKAIENLGGEKEKEQ